MADPGRLNTLLTLQRRADPPNSWNEQPAEWVDVAKLWADPLHQSGAQAIQSGAAASVVQCSIRTRARPGITAAMRLKGDGVAYDIKAVLPDRRQRGYINLVCEVVT